ncbi:hypothetical protein OJ997_06575 [Solirubrobacter phytolaccae]|uniref:Uncharacterized protein n=1 Tax=Solirubrobacter phytolaccae TaxID=1404360 RepID=A0A9X3NC22_9ACTN|nr:hypothetical protein [Solirubrobacter phytolaccae]MDA0179952.1 hypothetical protein [Solirubrobacter phytolaccae]
MEVSVAVLTVARREAEIAVFESPADAEDFARKERDEGADGQIVHGIRVVSRGQTDPRALLP